MAMSRIRSGAALFLTSAALAALALALLLYDRQQRRYFSGKTTMTMGSVLDKGALLGTRHRRRAGSEWFCWVSYTFTASDGAPRRNWRLWEPGCGTSRGRAIPVQYVVANPDINRPGGSEPSQSWWFFFFAAGVAVVIGVIVRRSEQNDRPDWRAMLNQ
jgi:hypothetical protein